MRLIVRDDSLDLDGMKKFSTLYLQTNYIIDFLQECEDLIKEDNIQVEFHCDEFIRVRFQEALNRLYLFMDKVGYLHFAEKGSTIYLLLMQEELSLAGFSTKIENNQIIVVDKI